MQRSALNPHLSYDLDGDGYVSQATTTKLLHNYLLTVHYPPPAYCLLPTAHCLLPTAYCLLPTAYCLLPTAHYHYSLPTR